jgi:hypothetical protein
MHVPYAFVRLNLKFKKVLSSGERELVLAGSALFFKGTFDSGLEIFIRTIKSLGKVHI